MKASFSILPGCAVALLVLQAADAAPAAAKPNVLCIAIDDLNDWGGCLGGHPQAKTPHIDRLAKRGALFTNAHCAAPLCNPSRAAVFSGRQPFETGVFANDDTNLPKLRPDLVLNPQHFKAAGYRTYGTGKLLHQTSAKLFDEDHFPERRWSPFAPEQVSYSAAELPSKGTSNPRHVTELKGKPIVLSLNRMPSDHTPDSRAGDSFDWGPLEVDDLDMGDGQSAAWAGERLRRKHEQPFFIAVGFYRPHIPLFAPKKYFDLYAGLDIVLPAAKSNDLDDLSAGGFARGYENDCAKGFTDVTDKVHPFVVWATGGIVSTVEDLRAWSHALLEADVLPPDLHRQLREPVKLRDGSPVRWGLEVAITETPYGTLLGHGGGPLRGNTGAMGYLPAKNLMVTTLVNGSSQHSVAIVGAAGWKTLIAK